MPLSVSTPDTYTHRQPCHISLPCHTFFRKHFAWYIFISMFSVIWFAIYGAFITVVTWVPREGCVGAGYRAFPRADFPLPCAWRWVLDHILPVIPVFAFLSAFLHLLTRWFVFPHSILLGGILPPSSSFLWFLSLSILAKVACLSSSSCDPPGTSASFWVRPASCVTTLHTKLPVQDSCQHTRPPSKLPLGQHRAKVTLCDGCGGRCQGKEPTWQQCINSSLQHWAGAVLTERTRNHDLHQWLVRQVGKNRRSYMVLKVCSFSCFPASLRPAQAWCSGFSVKLNLFCLTSDVIHSFTQL